MDTINQFDQENEQQTNSTILTRPVTITAPSLMTPMKLVQFRPAWTLHALLRFYEFSYETENISFSRAHDKPLPL